jgi:hypothetical protein
MSRAAAATRTSGLHVADLLSPTKFNPKEDSIQSWLQLFDFYATAKYISQTDRAMVIRRLMPRDCADYLDCCEPQRTAAHADGAESDSDYLQRLIDEVLDFYNARYSIAPTIAALRAPFFIRKNQSEPFDEFARRFHKSMENNQAAFTPSTKIVLLIHAIEDADPDIVAQFEEMTRSVDISPEANPWFQALKTFRQLYHDRKEKNALVISKLAQTFPATASIPAEQLNISAIPTEKLEKTALVILAKRAKREREEEEDDATRLADMAPIAPDRRESSLKLEERILQLKDESRDQFRLQRCNFCNKKGHTQEDCLKMLQSYVESRI